MTIDAVVAADSVDRLSHHNTEWADGTSLVQVMPGCLAGTESHPGPRTARARGASADENNETLGVPYYRHVYEKAGIYEIRIWFSVDVCFPSEHFELAVLTIEVRP